MTSSSILRSDQVLEMPDKNEFTESELEAVTMVFKQYETGVREACINVKDLLPALVSLGLNMMEQEVHYLCFMFYVSL